MPRQNKKSKRKSHRAIDGEVLDINTKIDIDRVVINRIGFRDSNPREAKNIQALNVSMEIESDHDLKINSQYDIIRAKQLSDKDNKITVKLDPKKSDQSLDWQEADISDLETHEVARIMSQLYPNISDNYVLYRHLQVRGYQINDDNTLVEVNGELIEDFTLDDEFVQDIDFLFVDGDLKDSMASTLAGREDLFAKLPIYDRRKVNKFGDRVNNINDRAFVMAVISDSGKIYALRFNTRELSVSNTEDSNNFLRLQRVRSIRDNEDVLRVLQTYHHENKIRQPRKQHLTLIDDVSINPNRLLDEGDDLDA